MNEKTIVMGNPPFNGSRLMTDEQKEDTFRLWAGTKGSGNIDYVANWFLLGAKWSAERSVRVGLVSTSSISQGEQPALIWGKIQPMGVGIDFAYRSFWWDNGAAVHCVIVGFSAHHKPKKLPLWFFSDVKGKPELSFASNINPYLLDAPDILISSRTAPLQSGTQKMDFGSMPNDGGYLSDIDSEEAGKIQANDARAAKYLRKIIGARELLHNIDRYCLWLVEAEPADIRNSPELSARVKAVKEIREQSKRESTKRLADRPAEFGEIRQPSNDYIAVPRVSSETRDYVPMALCSSEVITNDSLQLIPDGDLATFGLLMSSVFNVWNKTVSGRLKSDTRISGTITYNNFPFPEMEDEKRERVEKAAQQVLDARGNFPESSLADLYDPASMPSVLRKAHKELDKYVLSLFGLKSTATDEEILSELFKRYAELTKGLI
jgi:hypothetical protein